MLDGIWDVCSLHDRSIGQLTQRSIAKLSTFTELMFITIYFRGKVPLPTSPQFAATSLIIIVNYFEMRRYLSVI
jgi:hypothetical protein